MIELLQVTNLRFAPAPMEERPSGLLGWVAFDLGHSLHMDGIALRRTSSGRLALSYPARRDGSGRLHHHVRPIHDSVRVCLERQVFALLGQELVP